METSPVNKYILALLFLSLYLSCDEDEIDCEAVDCISFPALAFEITLDGENVFAEGIFTVEDVSVSGTYPEPSELTLGETVSANGNTPILIFSSFAWEETTYDFNLNIGNEYNASLSAEITISSSGGCCDGIPFISTLELNGVPVANPNSLLTLNLD